MTEVLRREMTLKCPPERAFRAFTEHVDLWWPRTHRRSREHAMRFTSDALIQTAPDGGDWTMGKVLAFEPPARLLLDWFAGAVIDPTRVEVTFAPEGDGTRVIIVHEALTAETIELWPKRVTIFVGGWEAALGALNEHIGGTNG
jgi:uncharacterized protein YndB with AHSA1/START domain